MKRNAIARIIIWSFTALLLIGVLVASICLGGLGKYFKDSGFSVNVGGNTYPNAESYNVGNGSISDKIDSVNIHWVSGNIEISVYDGDTVEINEGDVSNEDYKLRYKVEGGELKIQAQKSGWGIKINNFDALKKKLSVKIPSAFMDNFKRVEIDSVSAEINVSDITALDKFLIKTVSGDVKINDIKTYLFDFDSVSGELNLSGEINEFDGESVSGKLNLTAKTELEKFDAETTSGDIKLLIPESNGFKLDFDTTSGDFNSNLPMETKGFNRVINRIYGNGKAEFEIETVSGDVTVNKILN